MRKVAATGLLLMGMMSALQAQAAWEPVEGYRAGHEAQKYSQEGRRWVVMGVRKAGEDFKGCAAMTYAAGFKRLWVENYEGKWYLVLPTGQTGLYGRGRLIYDERPVNGRFTLGDGVATRELSEHELQWLLTSKTLNVQLNGDQPLQWNIEGLNKASMKVLSCRRAGGKPRWSAMRPQVSAYGGGLDRVIER